MNHQPEVLDPVERDAGPEAEVLPAEHAVRFDLSSLISEHRERLIEDLEAVPVPFLFVEENIIESVPGYEQEFVEVVTGSGRQSAMQSMRSAVVHLEGEPLSVGRRGVAFAVDAIMTGLLVWAALSVLDDGGLVALGLLTIVGINHVIGLGERGRSLGKALVGARVRRRAGGPLSFVEAGVRLLLREGPLLLAGGVSAGIDEPSGVFLLLQLAGVGCFVGMIASILLNPQFRGAHDQVVDSAVVGASSVPGQPIVG